VQNFCVTLRGAAAGCAVEESVFFCAVSGAMKIIARYGSFDYVAYRHFAQDDMRFLRGISWKKSVPKRHALLI